LVDTPGIDDSMRRCDGIAHDLEVWCVPVGEVPPRAKGVCVYTKVDLGDPPAGVLAVSAVTGVGLDALCDAIDEALLSIEGAAGASVMSARQRALLMRVRTQLTSVLELVRSQSPTAALMQPELVAVQLRECLNLVGEITGHIDADDVLGLVFSSFCIGK